MDHSCQPVMYQKSRGGVIIMLYNMGLQRVTADYRVVTAGYSKLPSGYSGLQQVTAGYRVVTMGYSR